MARRRSRRAPESPRPRPGRARCRGASLDRLRPRPCTPATVAVCAARVAFLSKRNSFCQSTVLGVPESARAARSAKISANPGKIRHHRFFAGSDFTRWESNFPNSRRFCELPLRKWLERRSKAPAHGVQRPSTRSRFSRLRGGLALLHDHEHRATGVECPFALD